MNTPKIRFKGFADDWEQRKLIDYLDVSNEKNKKGDYKKSKKFLMKIYLQ